MLIPYTVIKYPSSPKGDCSEEVKPFSKIISIISERRGAYIHSCVFHNVLEVSRVVTVVSSFFPFDFLKCIIIIIIIFVKLKLRETYKCCRRCCAKADKKVIKHRVDVVEVEKK